MPFYRHTVRQCWAVLGSACYPWGSCCAAATRSDSALHGAQASKAHAGLCCKECLVHCGAPCMPHYSMPPLGWQSVRRGCPSYYTVSFPGRGPRRGAPLLLDAKPSLPGPSPSSCLLALCCLVHAATADGDGGGLRGEDLVLIMPLRALPGPDAAGAAGAAGAAREGATSREDAAGGQAPYCLAVVDRSERRKGPERGRERRRVLHCRVHVAGALLRHAALCAAVLCWVWPRLLAAPGEDVDGCQGWVAPTQGEVGVCKGAGWEMFSSEAYLSSPLAAGLGGPPPCRPTSQVPRRSAECTACSQRACSYSMAPVSYEPRSSWPPFLMGRISHGPCFLWAAFLMAPVSLPVF